ncbi:MAG: hypothetical protein H0T53_11725 [Herpetosiphonaceae bacterium]|nr:hypothetical protein [Herpetosiphonaceae bacterium]
MTQSDWTNFLIAEVHNYGGFFGGNTVTFDAAPLAAPDDLRTLVIDTPALDNIRDRHTILANMVLALQMDGDRVDHARLLAAPTHEELRDALGPARLEGSLEAPLVLSGRCPSCERWVLGELLRPAGCGLCSAAE